MLYIDLFFKNHSRFLISHYRSGYDFNLFHKFKILVYLETVYVFDSGIPLIFSDHTRTNDIKDLSLY